jgi:hypothetical protein
MSELDDMDDMSCDEFAGVAAELALGVLTGRERAAALAHLDGCESCREQVRELTMVQDELLALLPSQEPPAGFESRVLERIGLTAPGQPSDASDEDLSDVPGQHAERELRGHLGELVAAHVVHVVHVVQLTHRLRPPGEGLPGASAGRT